MKTMITGAAGFIGMHLAKSLTEQGKKLILIDNFARGRMDEKFKQLINLKNVQFFDLDLTRNNVFDVFDDDISKVYHLAAINGTENFYNIPEKVLKVNILSTLNLLDWAVDKNNLKILFSSSSEVYAGSIKYGLGKIPTSEDVPLCIEDISNVRWSYGASKLLAENAFFSYSKSYNVKFSIIRYHNIYGPRMGFEHVIPQFLERIYRNQLPLEIYGGSPMRAFCYVSDAIRATQIVMESKEADNRIIHIGNDQQEISITNLGKIMLNLTGEKPEIIQRETPKGSVDRRCPDINSLKKLGFNPEISLEEGLILTNNWYKKYFLEN